MGGGFDQSFCISSVLRIGSFHADEDAPLRLWLLELMTYGNKNNNINKQQLVFTERFLCPVPGVTI